MSILLLNFAHPLTGAQLAQAAALLGQQPAVRNIAVQIDRGRPLADVAREMADAAQLAPDAWQTQPLLINPPGLAPLALALLAELHGRCGYFPALLNIRPVADATPPRYEVAEIVNLQALRDAARAGRS
jgi:hypothetical protein